MNLVFSGLHGTGKSTIARKVAAHFGLQWYSLGNAFRDMAKQKGMTLEEFSRYAEDKPAIDKEVDYHIVDLAKTDLEYVFDGQMPPFMLKDLAKFKILLKCEDEVRIKRMANRDGRNFEDQKHETLVREESERQRFIDFYGIDVSDPQLILKTFDLIVNTTNLSITQVEQVCIRALESMLEC